MSTKNIAWFVAYLAVMLGVYLALNSYRARAIAAGTDQANARWQEWRDAAEEMGKNGPVQRRKPKSAEPPSLVLMRDHFASCVGISLLLTSCLYVWFMICVRGVLQPVTLHDEDLENTGPESK